VKPGPIRFVANDGRRPIDPRNPDRKGRKGPGSGMILSDIYAPTGRTIALRICA